MAGCLAFIKEFHASILASSTSPFFLLFFKSLILKKIKLAKQRGQPKQIQEIQK